MTNRQLDRAWQHLTQGGYTCVICQQEHIYTSTHRGVKPLLTWLEEKTDMTGAVAADKVVGKAAAYLYVLLGVRAVYAGVISTPALQVLQSRGIEAKWGREVPMIQNRRGDGFCPMEQAVMDIHEPHAAKEAVEAKLRELQAN